MLGLVTDQEAKQVADAAYLYTLYQNSRHNVKHSFVMSSATATFTRLSSTAIFIATASAIVLTKYLDH